jgi:putative nucleotidyltransferase with HDIG domain
MRNIRAEIEKINQIVTLPTVLAEIMGELGKEEAVTSKITRMVETDPAITSSILRVANSPFYGVRRRIDSVASAIVLLGHSEISHLLITFYMKQQLRALSPGQQSYLELLWQHSVNTAALSSLIAKEYELPTGGKEYTAGLLHDMGKIVMVQYFTADFEKANRMVSESGRHDTELESEIVGIAHSEAGALLGESWRLPVEFVEVMKYHHTPRSATVNPELTAVIRFADLLAESWGSGIGERQQEKLLEGDESFLILGEQEPRVKAQGLEGVIARLSERHVEQKSLVGMF